MPKLVDYDAAKELLAKYGVKSADAKYVKSAEHAIDFAAGKPIALKVISDKALHKSKSCVIALNLITPDQVKKAYNALRKKAQKFRPYRILAQKMAASGIEIIIGGRVDPQFGPLILIGLGGIYVEAFRDFSVRICPITRDDAQLMLDELRSRYIIAPDAKRKKMLAAVLLNVSRMLMQSNIQELDLNPIILHDNTYTAVDLRMIR